MIYMGLESAQRLVWYLSGEGGGGGVEGCLPVRAVPPVRYVMFVVCFRVLVYVFMLFDMGLLG